MAKEFDLEIVAPDGQVFSGLATRFRAPGIDGAFEILANHAPMTAVMAVGPVYVTTAAGERIAFAASGGFVQVAENRVIMLAESAEPASSIDVDRAKKAEEKAMAHMKEAEGSADRTEAEKELERARNRLRIAMGNVGAK